MNRETIFSPCRRYRYTLWREWDVSAELWSTRSPLWTESQSPHDLYRGDQYVQFIGLNPSTADELNDDPTIRRCIDFAKRWGFGALCMTNAFAWRDTDPEAMKKAEWPQSEPRGSGTENNDWLIKIAKEAGLVIAAWGRHGSFQNRQSDIVCAFQKAGISLHCLAVNDDGTPKHPLYLPKTAMPIPYEPTPVHS